MSEYVKARRDKRPPLDVNYSFVQSFHITPQKNRELNEGYVISAFLNKTEAERIIELEIMKFIYQFVFATKEQIRQHLLNRSNISAPLKNSIEELKYKKRTVEKFITEDLDKIIDSMTEARELNFFYLAATQLSFEPGDGAKIYCTDRAGRYILSHFFREEVVFWKTTDVAMSPEIVVKYLSAAEFYLSLYANKGRNIRAFEAGYDAPIGTRDIRFSAHIEMTDGVSSRNFILESVRECDVPIYFRKKITEQIAPFILRGFWKKVIRPPQPEFIFLCQNLEIGKEISDIYYRYFEKNDFFITTDDEIAKGMDKASFYKYDGMNLEEGFISDFR